jgi:hypothetical protein
LRFAVVHRALAFAVILACSACEGWPFRGPVIAAIDAHDSELVTFDHGESYDTLVMHGMKPRERPLVARAYLYLPSRAAVERSMIWKAGDRPSRRDPQPLHPFKVAELADKVMDKYVLVGTMIERRALASRMDIVAPGTTASPSAVDLRIHVRLPSARPSKPDIPDPGPRKMVVAATVVGMDAFEAHVGARSLTLREDPGISDFKPRMQDLLRRLEQSVTHLAHASRTSVVE